MATQSEIRNWQSAIGPADPHRLRTLLFVIILHAFTHVYQVALMPLYLPIRDGLHLSGVEQATLLLTVMYVAYFLPSYPMGILADRCSRKQLLAWGLAVNALGFVGLALAPSYPLALVCAIGSGLGGSTFHPAATALIARLYPGITGRALGFVGIGASVGFFFGPLYAGWRAEHAHSWRAPVLELGIAGLVAAALFAWLATEKKIVRPLADSARPRQEPMFPTGGLWAMFLMAAVAFSWRDFTGSSMGTLGSLFLQKARSFGVRETGLIISFIFIASAISNPLFGHLSDGARLRWAAAVTLVAACFVGLFPHVSPSWIVPALVLYGFFFMSNYPIVEASLMEAVPDSVRGRVFGLFITVGGLLGNIAHWLMGHIVQGFGPRAADVSSYYSLYGGLALLLVASMAGLPCLRAISRREHALAGRPRPAAPHPFEGSAGA